MRKLIVLLFFFCSEIIIYSGTVIYNLTSGVILKDSTYQSPFYFDAGLSHNPSKYTLTDTARVCTENGEYYEIQSFRSKETAEDYKEFGDSIFDKICISYYASSTDSTPSKTYIFHNDNLWTRFNYWGFGNYTEKRWRPSEDILLRKIRLSPDCYAVVFRGFADAIDPAELTVFILHNGECELVYNQCRDIVNITEDGSTTTFTLLRADYSVGYDKEYKSEIDILIPRYQTMEFGKMGITLSPEVSDIKTLSLLIGSLEK